MTCSEPTVRKPLNVVAPTFREVHHVRPFVQSWLQHLQPGDRLVIVNANPGDETSDVISELRAADSLLNIVLIELQGRPDEFWSGTINRGLRLISDAADPDHLLFVTNIDVRQNTETLTALLNAFSQDGMRQLSPLCVGSGGQLMSSGTKYVSWLLALTRHPFQGLTEKEVSAKKPVEVDYCTTRSLLTSVKALQMAGFPDAERLPHYSADNEWSLRMTRNGFTAFIIPDAKVTVDSANTGKGPRLAKGFVARVSLLFSKKSSYNVVYRWRFAQLALPVYARFFGGVSYVLKSAAAVVFLR
jgi:GT2 family glycosyltransferase